MDFGIEEGDIPAHVENVLGPQLRDLYTFNARGNIIVEKLQDIFEEQGIPYNYRNILRILLGFPGVREEFFDILDTVPLDPDTDEMYDILQQNAILVMVNNLTADYGENFDINPDDINHYMGVDFLEFTPDELMAFGIDEEDIPEEIEGDDEEDIPEEIEGDDEEDIPEEIEEPDSDTTISQSDMSVNDSENSMGSGKKGLSKIQRRAQLIKKLMKEKGLKMIEASKLIKAKNMKY